MTRKRVAVLISGRGSNMRALVEACKDSTYPADIVLLISNVAEAGGLAFAKGQGIATAVIDHKAFSNRAAFDEALHACLVQHGIELVCCAGFMRILSPAIVDRWQGRMLNIHPSLLPDYKGLNTHARALADGRKQAGCSVHFVTSELDGGQIVAQAAVPILPGETPESLAARVLEVEHPLYVKALKLVASGQITARP